jgi:hypothetical protein
MGLYLVHVSTVVSLIMLLLAEPESWTGLVHLINRKDRMREGWGSVVYIIDMYRSYSNFRT